MPPHLDEKQSYGSAKAIEGLIFPSQATTNIYSQLRQLDKAGLSIRNRVCSIESDAEFVNKVQFDLGLPLIANERSGSWYVKPELKAGSAYFKSTDGHFGQWSFSLRRLNLQVLDIIANHGGCIIVDSTRRGKHLPDALSKTIPIWCAVLNRLLFPESKERHAVETLSEIVPESEVSSIESLIPSFVGQIQALELDVPAIRDQLKKPMKAIWIVRSLGLSADAAALMQAAADDAHSLVLCMASGMASDFQPSSSSCVTFEYIQGAADDSEAWAHGLNPDTFWAHKNDVISASETELLPLIRSISITDSNLDVEPKCFPIVPQSGIFVGPENLISKSRPFDGLIISCCSNSSISRCSVDSREEKDFLQLLCGRGKQGSRDLRRELAKLDTFLEGKETQRILICCPTGKDISIGVALVILIKYANDQGLLVQPLRKAEKPVEKSLTKKKLSWILVSVPEARPSRATLNSVNSFLIPQPA